MSETGGRASTCWCSHKYCTKSLLCSRRRRWSWGRGTVCGFFELPRRCLVFVVNDCRAVAVAVPRAGHAALICVCVMRSGLCWYGFYVCGLAAYRSPP